MEEGGWKEKEILCWGSWEGFVSRTSRLIWLETWKDVSERALSLIGKSKHMAEVRTGLGKNAQIGR